MTGTQTLRVPAGGTYNLREVGSYRTDLGVLRGGKLYRSDALDALTPDGRRTLEGLGIRLIIDLRTDQEVAAGPTVLDESVTIVHAPIFTDGSQPVGLGQTEVSLSTIYDLMIDGHGPQLTDAVRHIAGSNTDSVLVHCTAGKDRTGLVIALTLLAVGVEPELVVADYALTADNLAGPWAAAMIDKMQVAGIPVTPALHEIVTASPAVEMARVIERWESEWGSAAGYLAANGLTAEELTALTAALIV